MTLVLIAIGLLFSTNLKAQPSSTVTLTTSGNTTTITIDADGPIGCYSSSCGGGTCITGNLIIDNTGRYDYSIPNEAFRGCGLQSVAFYGNVGNIGERAFVNCSELQSVKFQGNVDNIGKYAFQNCQKLKTLIFASNVGDIEEGAFNLCNFKEVKFQGDVGNIGSFAFQSCQKLKKITFCGDVGEFVGGSVFQFCPLLRTIIFETKMIPPVTSGAGGPGNTFYDFDPADCVLIVPEGSLSEYKNTSCGWYHIYYLGGRIIEPPTRPYILHKTKLGKGAVLNIGKP